MKKTINVYVTNLGKYNEGMLVGKWLELPATDEEIQETLKEIGIGERYEEYFITDFESDFEYEIGEYDVLENLNEIAERLEDVDAEIFNAIYKNHDFEETIEILEDENFIIYDDCNNMEQVAERYAEESGLLDSIPEYLRAYFDFEEFGYDMELERDFVEYNNGYIEIIKKY